MTLPNAISLSDVIAQKGMYDGLHKHLVLDGAIDLRRSPDVVGGWMPASLRLTEVPGVRKLAKEYEERRADWLSRHADELSFPKVSLGGIEPPGDYPSSLGLMLERTEWNEVQPLHELLLADESDLHERLMTPLLRDGRWEVPNILTIHGVVVTLDESVVVAQRSARARYAPLHWSLSFEEQVEPDDLAWGGGALHHAAVRGVCEEFLYQGALDDSTTAVLAIQAEWKIANPSVVAVVHVPFHDDELLQAWQQRAIDAGEFESGSVHFVPLDIGRLSRILLAERYATDENPTGSWHPTSRHRLLLTMCHSSFGVEATFKALREAM